MGEKRWRWGQHWGGCGVGYLCDHCPGGPGRFSGRIFNFDKEN